MEIINENSLSLTLDALNDVFFFKKSITGAEKLKVAGWLAARQGKPGSYSGMFAPTEYDFNGGTVVYTGEKLESKASISHILGEEACRALTKLDVPDKDVKEALNRASVGIKGRLSSLNGFF